MPRTISWPTREQWQAKAEQAERTSCFARERVSSKPADWLAEAELTEARVLAAKVVRATRTALGKAGRANERYDLNDHNRRANDEYADVDDAAGGWSQIARIARSVEALPEGAARLTELSDQMRRVRDAAGDAAEEQAVAKAVAARATDAGWAKELERRARTERGPQLTTITVHADGTSTVSGPVPFEPSWPSY